MNGKMLGAVALAGITAGLGLVATPALAQSGSMTRTWVSGGGSDTYSCDRSSPCQTFARALTQTAPGGEVNCLDAAGYGAAMITGSVSIVCDNTEAGVISTGITINGPGAVVTLSGLDLDGFNNTLVNNAAVNGIQFTNGASLTLTNVKIRNFSGYGIRFEPSTAATLTVKNAVVTGNGVASTVSGGILLRPTAAVTASATISGTHLANNLNAGVRAETTLAGATVNATIVDTIASNNGIGLLFRVPAGTVNGSVGSSTLINNTGNGLNANGAGARIGIYDTTITANGTGVGVNGGAAVTTFGNNRLFANTSNGGFTAQMAQQ